MIFEVFVMNKILFVGEHPRTYNVQWHSHDHWELVYCTSGHGSFSFENGTVMNYRAGEAVFRFHSREIGIDIAVLPLMGLIIGDHLLNPGLKHGIGML